MQKRQGYPRQGYPRRPSAAFPQAAARMDLNSYLEELSKEQLVSLYDSYWTCQAVLRSLPPLAQQYVLRLLFIDQPLELSACPDPPAIAA